jgi:hypothetical protein
LRRSWMKITSEPHHGLVAKEIIVCAESSQSRMTLSAKGHRPAYRNNSVIDGPCRWSLEVIRTTSCARECPRMLTLLSRVFPNAGDWINAGCACSQRTRIRHRRTGTRGCRIIDEMAALAKLKTALRQAHCGSSCPFRVPSSSRTRVSACN